MFIIEQIEFFALNKICSCFASLSEGEISIQRGAELQSMMKIRICTTLQKLRYHGYQKCAMMRFLTNHFLLRLKRRGIYATLK